MGHTEYLRDALIFLLSVVVLIPLFNRLRVSPLLGYLAAGLVVGPHGLGLIESVETAAALGELGVVFLLFSIGLELSVDRLRVMRRLALGLGSAQLLGCAAVLGGAAYLLWGDGRAAIVVGAGLALSSTAVVLRLLVERGELSTRAGRAALAVLLLQDLAVVPLLVLVPLLARPDAPILATLALALGKGALALAAIVLIGRVVVRPVFRMVAATRSLEAFAALALLAALGTAWATQELGLSLALGAFLAGVLISETEYRHQVEADLRPFQGLLLGLFFLSVGMGVDVSGAAENVGFVLALTAGLLGIKIALTVPLALAFRLDRPDAVRVGFLLPQAGEFGFLLFALAAARGLLPDETAQTLAIVVALGMALTPATVRIGYGLAGWMEDRAQMRAAALTEADLDLVDHVVVAGFGRVGQTIGKLLGVAGVPFVAVDRDVARVAEARGAGLPVYYGDVAQPRMLHAAGAARARAVVVTLDDPERATQVVDGLRHEFPGLKILVRSRDTARAEELRRAGATVVVPELLEGSLQLGAAVLRAAGVAGSDAQHTVDELRRADYAALRDLVEPEPADGTPDVPAR